VPNNTLTVNVNVNFVNNQPNWTLAPPDKVTVNHGEIDTIKWQLNNGNLPSGAASLAFATSNAIQFVAGKPGKNDGSTWTGPSPNRDSATQVSVSDDNTTQSGTKHYYYSINVSTYDANGSYLQTYTLDPEVQNEGN
jgi:hypothetical protein